MRAGGKGVFGEESAYWVANSIFIAGLKVCLGFPMT
jgi:hypothetical protein